MLGSREARAAGLCFGKIDLAHLLVLVAVGAKQRLDVGFGIEGYIY